MKEIKENELVNPALKYLNMKNNGYASTTEIIQYIEKEMSPQGRDLEILQNRNDTHISQKVRNLICHRKNKTSFIRKGLAVYRDGGLQITQLGRKLVQN